MFILGSIAFLQLVFLPGFLFCRMLKIAGRVATLLLSFGFSLIINHLLVFLLTALKIYYRPIWIGLFAFELVLLCWLYRTSLFNVITIALPSGNSESYSVSRTKSIIRRGPFVVALLCSAVVVAAFAVFSITEIGTIFTTWDAIGSWNSWAVEWSTNRLPRTFGNYPQLVPTTLSLTYVYMGTSVVQFFGKAIMGLFPLGIVLAIFDLGIRTRYSGFLFATIATGWLLFKINVFPHENMLASGYADVPMSFFAVAGFYCLVRAQSEDSTDRHSPFWIAGAICSAGSALTKQPGLYFCFAYVLLSLIGLRGTRPGLSVRGYFRIFLGLSLLIAIIALPWYFYIHARLYWGSAQDNFKELLGDLHAGRTLLERMQYGLDTFARQLGRQRVFVGLCVLVVFSLFSRLRWLTILVTVPWSLIWAAGFSYSLRNLALAVPFVGICAGAGLAELLKVPRVMLSWTLGLMKSRAQLIVVPPVASIGSQGEAVRRISLRPLTYAHVVSLSIAPIFLLSLAYPAKRLVERQTKYQKQIGDGELNDFLYSYFTKLPPDGLILTHYPLISHLPGFEPSRAGVGMNRFDAYLREFEKPDVKYVLVPSWMHPSWDARILAHVEKGLEGGTLDCLYHKNEWLFARKAPSGQRELVLSRTTTRASALHDPAEVEKLVRQNRLHDAIELLLRLNMDALPYRGRAYYLYAFCLQYSSGATDKAIEYYRKALDSGADEFWVRYQRGMLYASIGKGQLALPDLKRAAKLHPSDANLAALIQTLNAKGSS